MNLLNRLEALEAKLLPKKTYEGYQVVLLQKGETKNQGTVRVGIMISPGDQIIFVRFVRPGESASDR